MKNVKENLDDKTISSECVIKNTKILREINVTKFKIFQLQKMSCTLLDHTKTLYGGLPVPSSINVVDRQPAKLQSQIMPPIKIEPITTTTTTPASMIETYHHHQPQQQQQVPLFRTVYYYAFYNAVLKMNRCLFAEIFLAEKMFSPNAQLAGYII